MRSEKIPKRAEKAACTHLAKHLIKMSCARYLQTVKKQIILLPQSGSILCPSKGTTNATVRRWFQWKAKKPAKWQLQKSDGRDADSGHKDCPFEYIYVYIPPRFSRGICFCSILPPFVKVSLLFFLLKEKSDIIVHEKTTNSSSPYHPDCTDGFIVNRQCGRWIGCIV